MFAQVFFKIIKLAIIFWVLLGVCLTWQTTESYSRYVLAKAIEAKSYEFISHEQHSIKFAAKDGRTYLVSPKGLIRGPLIKATVGQLKINAIQSFTQSSLLTLSLSGLVIVFLFNKGKKNSKQKQLRGSTRVEKSILVKQLKQEKVIADFNLADVPIPNETLNQHFLICGTTGTGKSIAITEMLSQIRSKGQRAVVYDVEGSFVPKFYRPGKDILLNPLDARSPYWSLWQECHEIYEFESAAASLIPMPAYTNDNFFIQAARLVFATIASEMRLQERRSHMTLLKNLVSLSDETLRSLTENTIAESLTSGEAGKMVQSIKATLANYAKTLLYLSDAPSPTPFSIKKWIEKSESDSWIFISSNEKIRESLNPLISFWLDTAIGATLALTPGQSKTWFVLDELDSLQPLPYLKDGLARGRKYGACFMLGFQDINQLAKKYGDKDAQTICALLNTKLLFRAATSEAAQWMSRSLGSQEIIETNEGLSYGAHETRDGVNIQSHKSFSPVVMDAECLTLPNLECFFKLSGNYPVTKLKLEWRQAAQKEPAFIQRENINNSFRLDDVSKGCNPDLPAAKNVENKVPDIPILFDF
ncbi:MAG: type IV secretion system DNA-binding domain-containing protein [Gammaproteobacteria bacterium]